MSTSTVALLTEQLGGRWAAVADDNDYAISDDGRLYSFSSHKLLKSAAYRDGYRYYSLNGRTRRIARLVADAFVDGRTTKRSQIDHIDRDVQNDSYTNLRWVSLTEQMLNRRLPNRHGLPGISQVGKSFVAQVRDLNSVIHWLGCYKTRDDAALVYAEAAVRLQGQFVLAETRKYWEDNRDHFASIVRSRHPPSSDGKYVYVTASGRFQVKIKRAHVGIYDSAEQATAARDSHLASHPQLRVRKNAARWISSAREPLDLSPGAVNLLHDGRIDLNRE